MNDDALHATERRDEFEAQFRMRRQS
jgi:hypothetical protein